jgi:hypothetical protein
MPFAALWLLGALIFSRRRETPPEEEVEYPVIEVFADGRVWRRGFTPAERCERLQQAMQECGQFEEIPFPRRRRR